MLLLKNFVLPHQVISTLKYREALALSSVPLIPLLGVNPSHPVITDRTQFTLLHLWCGKFVITHHQHALWVLDPSCNSVVATLAGRLPIIDITCCQDSVYLLQPDKCPIIKLTIHADFKRLLAPTKGLSSSISDLSSTLDSGSYKLSDEGSSGDHDSKVNTRGASSLTKITPFSSKEQLLSSQQNMPQGMSPSMSQSVSQNVSQDVSQVTPHTGIALAGMSIEDRVHKMHLSLQDTEPSSIAVQSVLKKKKKKRKKPTSHDSTG